MQSEIKLDKTNKANIHLSLYLCGQENCDSGHCWGPVVRDHYLIHYIESGKGTFYVEGKSYFLEAGQGFLICPDVLTTYTADKKDPWAYYWVGFNGLNAESYLKRANLTLDSPIFTYNKDNRLFDCFWDMLKARDLKKSRDIRFIGLLHVFLALLVESVEKPNTDYESKSVQQGYVQTAVEFIYMNYSRKITIEEISHFIGIDRKYLYHLFETFLNTSPQSYLINFRMNKACELMQNPALSIGDVSRSVGYENPLIFSKMFKKIKGVSPSQYCTGSQ